MIDECLLTTMDNMYDPFTQEDDWLRYDTEHRYFSNQCLARHCYASSNMTEEQYRQEVSDAIDRYLAINPLGIHYKLWKGQASVMIPIANQVFKESKLIERVQEAKESNAQPELSLDQG